MAEVHHFAYGVTTPLLAYVMSVVGSLLGLMCTARARAADGTRRASWLGLAALSIGGTGIWVMHFIAMLGFRVPGAQIRYDVPLTLLSAFIAMAVVGVGVFTVGFGGAHMAPLLSGGVVTGIGVASMHYTGMAAMHTSAHVGYNAGLVVLSVLIAMVAATAALWFTVRVRGAWATAGAALIMGVAVSGMHYTGMAAMRVELHGGGPVPDGARPFDFLLPLVVIISLLATVLLVLVAMSPTEDELRDETLRSAASGSASGSARGAAPSAPESRPPLITPRGSPNNPPRERS
ncbi:MHYT domain-containing protein [Spirillospora sp. NPDC048911]|uniref:MHYT domain-containing protein n=1 Tax=Spirillospora sp. NPDC048911 TaxID=3364527 RepID=UPI003717D549